MPASQLGLRVSTDHDLREMNGLFSDKGRIVPEHAIDDLQHFTGHGNSGRVLSVRMGNVLEHHFGSLLV